MTVSAERTEQKHTLSDTWHGNRKNLPPMQRCCIKDGVESSGVTRGADRPGWHPSGGDTRPKITFFVAEFRKNTG